MSESGETSVSESQAAFEFTGLYRNYQGLVRTVIYQIAGGDGIDDLVQEAFVRIWKGLPQFRGDSKITSWIYRVCTNLALDHCRQRSTRGEFAGPEALDSAAELPRQEVALTDRDLVEKGLAHLSTDHRAVLVLAYIHDLSISEIAQAVDVSEGTVKSRLHYAKAEFRQFLSSRGVGL